MNNMPAQNEPVSVDIGVMVMIPLVRWENLKNVEADKERYAQHILEHQKNLSNTENTIKLLEEKLAKYDSLSTKLEEAKTNSKANSEKLNELKDSHKKLVNKVEKVLTPKSKSKKK